MISPDLDALRLFVHVLAASVWIGGQVALAGIVPAVRRAAPEALTHLAQAFARVAWPAFAIAVVTGLWSMVEVSVADTSSTYQVTLFVKILVVMLSGTAAMLHQIARTAPTRAAGGAVGVLGGLAALFLGVLLTTGG